MGEWIQRAALIQGKSTSAEAGIPEGALLQPPIPESTQPEPGYRQYPGRYEFPRFVIPTAGDLVEFRLAVPKGKYDAFALLDLFIRHHGSDDSGQITAKIE
ncbi:hypothetical protein [Accumulibacter sp.]|uniref:hypothetical protein n=1 Tax=Accumulibacter sp. TaxID=2053492 RepID=UPI0026308F5B|nr:hypothetical protein [Accumulibacter sp.]